MQQSQTGQSNQTQTVNPASWMQTGATTASTLGTNIANQGWTPYTGQAVAGLSSNQQQAYNNAAAAGSAYAAPGGLGTCATKCLTGANLQPYMNPYTGGAVGALTQRVQQQYAPVQAGLTGTIAQGGNLTSNRAPILQGQLSTEEQNTITCMANSQYGGNVQAATQAFMSNRGNAATQGANIENQLQTTGALQQNVAQEQANFNYGQFLQQQYWEMCHQLPGAEMAVEGGALGAPVTTSGIGQGALTQSSVGSAIGLATALGAMGYKLAESGTCSSSPEGALECYTEPSGEGSGGAPGSSEIEVPDCGIGGCW
jgi:hypothetical protein